MASAPVSAQTALSPVGDWRGDFYNMPMTLEITADATGQLRVVWGQGDHPEIKAVCTEVRFEGGKLSFTEAKATSKWRGRHSKNGKHQRGMWDDGIPTPMNFDRVEAWR